MLDTNKTVLHEISHADIVLTHQCNMNCPCCIDKFRNQSKDIIKPADIRKFLRILKEHTCKTKSFGFDKNPNIEILLLGGEPTMVGVDYLSFIAGMVHSFGFEICISTNGIKRDVIEQIIPFYNWLQITVRSKKEIDFWRKYKDKVNIKLPGDHTLTLEKFNSFVEETKDFARKSLTMYFTPDFKELCTDSKMWEVLSAAEWERCGSYLYTFINGVRVKRCIPGITNIADEPLIPKLYPNGNYNKTWFNENQDSYLTRPCYKQA